MRWLYLLAAVVFLLSGFRALLDEDWRPSPWDYALTRWLLGMIVLMEFIDLSQ